MATSYCEAINSMTGDIKALHQHYHDTQYGFDIANDDELFGRLILEINQAGLSWTTILQKQENFRKAYNNFSIKKIANYNQSDIDKLLDNAGIIRNKLKINAAIYNAQIVLQLQKEHGSFKAWLTHHHPKQKAEWVLLFKKHFKFTGGEIVNEFLMSIGYLPGAHVSTCAIYQLLKK
jgi:DNA-3-methyladenine glycosylase I